LPKREIYSEYHKIWGNSGGLIWATILRKHFI
jgi:hypothetical protein